MHPVVDLDRPRRVVASIWIMAAFLALYSAPTVRDLVERMEWVEPDGALAATTGALETAADVLGVSALGAALEGVRSALHEPIVVLKRAPVVPVAATPAPAAEPPPVAEPVAGTAPAALAHRTAKRPTRILLVGASSMQYALGKELEAALEKYEGVAVKRFGKAATGLSRPDAFDWPKKVRALMDEFKPDLVITNYGGNDAQNLPLPNRDRAVFGTEKWDNIYSERVKELVTLARGKGADILMLGMPVMRSNRFSKRMQRLNGITKEATLAAGGWYLDTWDLAANRSGTYRESVQYKGRKHLLRQDDGIHYTRIGGEYVVGRLMRRIERMVTLVPGDPKLAPAERHDVESKAIGETSYMAYLPREAKAGKKVPVLFLLHGATGAWSDWSENAHQALQALAQQHQLAIVTPEGGGEGWYVDTDRVPDSNFETFIAKELVDDVSRHLPVTEVRGIGGLSMGGNGAIVLSMKHPGLFRSVSSMSGAVDLSMRKERKGLVDRLGPYDPATWDAHSALQRVKAAPAAAQKTPMRIDCGAKDVWAGANRALAAALTAAGVDHVFEEKPGGHSWDYWTARLPEHVAWHAEQLGAGPAAAPAP
jgi:predicted esterase